MAKETYNILDRWTGAIRFTAEIECSPTALPSLKLGLAIRVAIKKGLNLRGAYLQGANLRGVDLQGADLQGANLQRADLQRADLRGVDLQRADLQRADLRGVDLRGANLRGVDLQGADLQRVDLQRADLQGADLQRVDLRGANLRGANLQGEKIKRLLALTQRLYDGCWFYAFELESGGYKISAGCRWFTDAEYRDHVMTDYPHTTRAAETLAILDYFQNRAVSLEVIEASKEAKIP